MNDFIDKYTSNAFGSLLGYILSSYVINTNVWLIILITGFFFKAEFLYSWLLDIFVDKYSYNYKNKKSFLSIIVLVFFIFSVYLTVPIYKRGETLKITASVLKAKKEPGVGGYTIKRLKKGETVMYLDKLWKRTRFYENGFHWNFWLKVKMKNGEIGWIYGSYTVN